MSKLHLRFGLMVVLAGVWLGTQACGGGGGGGDGGGDQGGGDVPGWSVAINPDTAAPPAGTILWDGQEVEFSFDVHYVSQGASTDIGVAIVADTNNENKPLILFTNGDVEVEIFPSTEGNIRLGGTVNNISELDVLAQRQGTELVHPLSLRAVIAVANGVVYDERKPEDWTIQARSAPVVYTEPHQTGVSRWEKYPIDGGEIVDMVTALDESEEPRQQYLYTLSATGELKRWRLWMDPERYGEEPPLAGTVSTGLANPRFAVSLSYVYVAGTVMGDMTFPGRIKRYTLDLRGGAWVLESKLSMIPTALEVPISSYDVDGEDGPYPATDPIYVSGRMNDTTSRIELRNPVDGSRAVKIRGRTFTLPSQTIQDFQVRDSSWTPDGIHLVGKSVVDPKWRIQGWSVLLSQLPYSFDVTGIPAPEGDAGPTHVLAMENQLFVMGTAYDPDGEPRVRLELRQSMTAGPDMDLYGLGGLKFDFFSGDFSGGWTYLDAQHLAGARPAGLAADVGTFYVSWYADPANAPQYPGFWLQKRNYATCLVDSFFGEGGTVYHNPAGGRARIRAVTTNPGDVNVYAAGSLEPFDDNNTGYVGAFSK